MPKGSLAENHCGRLWIVGQVQELTQLREFMAQPGLTEELSRRLPRYTAVYFQGLPTEKRLTVQEEREELCTAERTLVSEGRVRWCVSSWTRLAGSAGGRGNGLNAPSGRAVRKA